MRAPRKSEAEWHAILDKFRSSGLTQAAFCEQENIKACTFKYWLYREKTPVPRFVPVVHVAEHHNKKESLERDPRVKLGIGDVAVSMSVDDCVRLFDALGKRSSSACR